VLLQFHYDLGMLLRSTFKVHDLGDAIFQVVDQINHGVPSLIQPEVQVDVADLNFSAGSRAMKLSDYKTAYSYLNNALSLLPQGHWNSHYELSLRLYFLKSKAAYSRGNIEEAHRSLKQILEKGRCADDMLDAYHLHVSVSASPLPAFDNHVLYWLLTFTS